MAVRRAQRDGGASVVELALISPVMILVVMGALDLSRAYRMQIRLENAAREGAQYAQIEPNRVECAGDDDVPGHVVREDPDIASLPNFQVKVWTDTEGTSDMALPITTCGGTRGDPDDRLLVEVSADFELITPMVEKVVGETITVTGEAMVEVQG